jgi:hypothetical protein
MSRLRTASNLQGPDDFYQALIEAHRDLTDEQSMALNARLVLLLANHIGDLEVLREALHLARDETLQTDRRTPET